MIQMSHRSRAVAGHLSSDSIDTEPRWFSLPSSKSSGVALNVCKELLVTSSISRKNSILSIISAPSSNASSFIASTAVIHAIVLKQTEIHKILLKLLTPLLRPVLQRSQLLHVAARGRPVQLPSHHVGPHHGGAECHTWSKTEHRDGYLDPYLVSFLLWINN